MEKMYRVLLANGSEEFCGKLGVALKQTNRYSVVGSACDGVRAISLLKELKPDLLVVDLKVASHFFLLHFHHIILDPGRLEEHLDPPIHGLPHIL